MAAAKKSKKDEPKEQTSLSPATSEAIKQLAPVEVPALVEVPQVVAPLLDGNELTAVFNKYRELQNELDHSMPDQIMQIQGKSFRKKGYWRAIRMAFNLNVECIKDDRITTLDAESGHANWGYAVTYRATAPNGATAEGDGCCMASEKTNKKGEIIATEHNVRSHAHTRAFNRAVSNLVGFGEVSAEEVEHDAAVAVEIWPYDNAQHRMKDTEKHIEKHIEKEYGLKYPGSFSQPPKQEPNQQAKGGKLSEAHIELKKSIETFVVENDLPESDKAHILKELTQFTGKSGTAFAGIPNYDFSHKSFSEKLAQMALHKFKERKDQAEAEIRKARGH